MYGNVLMHQIFFNPICMNKLLRHWCGKALGKGMHCVNASIPFVFQSYLATVETAGTNMINEIDFEKERQS